jgi:hypothetical protein
MATNSPYQHGAVRVDSTQVTRYAYLQQTDGTAATGRTHLTSGLTAHYVRQGAAPVPVPLLEGTPTATWGAGRFAEVDATHCPGLYRVDWPDAAFAFGTAETVTLVVTAPGLRPFEDVVPLALADELWGGEAATGATPTTLPTTGLPTLTQGQLHRRLLQFTGGPCLGERVLIVGQAANGTLQVAPPLTVAPSDGDPFVIR